MKDLLKYLGVFCLIAAACVALVGATTAPDRVILGDWQQTDWVYEMVDLPKGGEPASFLEEVKYSVGKGLVVHEAETWRFLPDHRLRLLCSDRTVEARWRLKGRGHILQIIHDDGTKESYVLDQLDKHTMRLQFETDLQARGIASLVFSR